VKYGIRRTFTRDDSETIALVLLDIVSVEKPVKDKSTARLSFGETLRQIKTEVDEDVPEPTVQGTAKYLFRAHQHANST